MTTQSTTWQRLFQLEGYLLIPHELLHVAAHRLIGRAYAYEWGDAGVDKREPCTWREDLFCLLFPLMVTLPIALAPLLVWIVTFLRAGYQPDAYLAIAPLWHPLLFLFSFGLLTYVVTTSLFDVVFAVQILLRQLTHQAPDQPRTDHHKG